MKYLMLICDDEQAWGRLSDKDRSEMMGEYRRLIDRLKGSGHYLGGSQLQPTATATSVRVRNGKRLLTDGPFAETREQLGGYFLIEAKDLDEALSIAAEIPSARDGTIEVRPLVEVPAGVGA